MKKTLLFAVAASVALSGCVKNDPANGGAVASDAKISFDAPAVGAVTRAEYYGEIVGAYPKDESFKVWGWYHERDYTTFNDATNGWKNYMTDASGNPIAVSHNGEDPGSWVSATDYYWPKNGGKLTFAAYSPADAVGTYTHVAEGLQIADFTVAAAGAQYDLMYSDRSYNRTSSNNQYNGQASNTYTGVDIVFHHALSSIVFKVGTTENYSAADLDFKIKKIEIKGAYNQGTFNEGLTDGNNSKDRTPAWSGQTGTADYVAFTGSFNVPEDGTTRTEPTDAEDLILLPQTFSDSHDVVVEITYTMETAASGEIEHVKQFNLKDATNAATWEPNKRYTYQILFGVEKILFAPVVEDWTDVTVTDDIKF